jgi:hypothetical protein
MFRETVRSRVAQFALGASAALLVLTACNLEDIAGAVDAVTATSGQITIWTSDSSPSPIEVSVDGRVVGTLTAYRTSAPSCGVATHNGAITITRAAGTYTLSARETRASGVWPARSFTLEGGGCAIHVLNP